jgi:hypothetical protein
MTGIQGALDFLQAARRQDSLRLALGDLSRDVTLDDLARLAQAAGFSVTTHDLQRAYAIDWRLRQAYYLVHAG